MAAAICTLSPIWPMIRFTKSAAIMKSAPTEMTSELRLFVSTIKKFLTMHLCTKWETRTQIRRAVTRMISVCQHLNLPKATCDDLLCKLPNVVSSFL
ncbi:hypothetical protein COOONC_12111 [Cooperia oncophora]